MIQRLRDWPERLDAVLRLKASCAFAWGTNDCCTLCADAIQAMTGVDVMATLRGRYATAFEALGLMQSLGGLQAAVTDLLGEPCSPALCTVGDVLLLQNEDRDILALCNGGTALVAGQNGLVSVADPHIVAAWRVG